MPIAAAEIEKYRQYCPESKTDADITALVAEKNGEEAEIQRVISTWWEQALAGTLSAADTEPETTTPYSPQAVDTVRSRFRNRAVGLPPAPREAEACSPHRMTFVAPSLAPHNRPSVLSFPSSAPPAGEGARAGPHPPRVAQLKPAPWQPVRPVRSPDERARTKPGSTTAPNRAIICCPSVSLATPHSTTANTTTANTATVTATTVTAAIATTAIAAVLQGRVGRRFSHVARVRWAAWSGVWQGHEPLLERVEGHATRVGRWRDEPHGWRTHL